MPMIDVYATADGEPADGTCRALSPITGRRGSHVEFRAGFCEAGTHAGGAAAYFAGPGLVRALSSVKMAGVSATPIRWNLVCLP
jgi:hypothetical protein